MVASCSHLRNVLLARECVDASLQRQRPVIVLPIVADRGLHRGVERVRRGGGGVIIFLFERGTPVSHKCVTSEPQSINHRGTNERIRASHARSRHIRGHTWSSVVLPAWSYLHGSYMVLPTWVLHGSYTWVLHGSYTWVLHGPSYMGLTWSYLHD